MELDVLVDSEAVARKAAAIIAADARASVAARGRYVLAVSGGKTPWQMLRAMIDEQVPWKQVHLFQVDERIAPAGHADRNLTHIFENLLSRVPIPAEQVHAMPVEADDLEVASQAYAESLRRIAGSPPVLDLIHLGLGPDGHTASLVPGDSSLSVTNTDVTLTGKYQGRSRMTLTYPIINRSRRILWVVTGSEKAGPLRQLCDADPSIPAGRVSQERAVVLADQAAAVQLRTI